MTSRRALPLLALLLAAGCAVASPEEASYVPARDHAATALRLIDGAQRSVDVFMYLFTPRPDRPEDGPFRLFQALRNAHDRGVRVRVVLDQGPGPRGPSDEPADAANGAARDLLAAAGVPVFLDDPAVVTHAKVLIVDGTSVLLGSSNWTEAAFTSNVEADVLVRSTAAAAEALRDLERAVPPAPPAAPPVPVPWAVMTRPDLLGRMVSQPDERAFDAYLYLLKAGRAGSAPFTLDTRALADALGIGGMTRVAYRRQIHKTLVKLRDVYGLIDLEERFKEDPAVALRPVGNAQDALFIPDGYWDGGWPRRLSFPGKVFYLLSLRYAALSPDRPLWSVPEETLAARHHVSPWFVSHGVTALRRAALLEVSYGPLSAEGGPRPPSTYIPRALYDPRDMERRFQALRERYGAPAAARAVHYAALVYAEADAAAVERLILLEERYGPDRLQWAARYIGAKDPDNPRRTLSYFIAAVQDKGGDR